MQPGELQASPWPCPCRMCSGALSRMTCMNKPSDCLQHSPRVGEAWRTGQVGSPPACTHSSPRRFLLPATGRPAGRPTQQAHVSNSSSPSPIPTQLCCRPAATAAGSGPRPPGCSRCSSRLNRCSRSRCRSDCGKGQDVKSGDCQPRTLTPDCWELVRAWLQEQPLHPPHCPPPCVPLCLL